MWNTIDKAIEFVALLGGFALVGATFWLFWTGCQIGTTFAYWLPAVYQTPTLWQCVGLAIVIKIIGEFVPASINVTVIKKDDE